MPPQTDKAEVNIAVSTSAILDMSAADAIWRAEQTGQQKSGAYFKYMKNKMDKPFEPGPLFETIKALAEKPNHKIILVSRNSLMTGIRAMRTLLDAQIVPDKFSFTNGRPAAPYLAYYKPNKFLTLSEEDAKQAHDLGIATVVYDHLRSATVSHTAPQVRTKPNFSTDADLRRDFLARSGGRKLSAIYDFDGVLADTSSDKIFEQHGLEAFRNHEANNVRHPMESGPHWKEFVRETGDTEEYITHIVSSRGTVPFMRIAETLLSHGIEPTGESHGTNGKDKGPLLKIMCERYGPETMFADDSASKVENAQKHGIKTAGRAVTN